MTYKYRYMNPVLQGGAEDRIFEKLDEQLFGLQENKGRFYAQTVEFVLQMRLLNNSNIMHEHAKDRASNFVAQYVGATLEEVYGKQDVDKKLVELMADVDDMTISILVGLKAEL